MAQNFTSILVGSPNPTTPLALVSAEIGSLISMTQFIIIGSLAILVWDILDTLLEDYELVFVQQMNMMTIVFLMSRIGAFVFLFLSALTMTIAPGECAVVGYALIVAFALYRTSTCWLFYVRAKALYSSNRLIRILLASSMLFSIFGAVLPLWSTTAFRLGISPSTADPRPKGICIPRTTEKYWWIAITPITESLFDILVCAAVTYRIRHLRDVTELNMAQQYAKMPSAYSGWRRWIFSRKGRPQSRLADRYLRDSQIYFIITLFVKIPEIVLIIFLPFFRPNASGFSVVIAWPDATITSIVATKVYRNMRLRRKGLNLPLVGRTITMEPTFLNARRAESSIKFMESGGSTFSDANSNKVI